MFRSNTSAPSFAQPLPHDQYPWDNSSTPFLERYELRWKTAQGDSCHGVVVRIFGIYYACVEVRHLLRTTERWARDPFRTAAAARMWVQGQLASQGHAKANSF